MRREKFFFAWTQLDISFINFNFINCPFHKVIDIYIMYIDNELGIIRVIILIVNTYRK